MVCIQFAFTLDGFRLRSESDREIRNERRLPIERRLLPRCSAAVAAAAAAAAAGAAVVVSAVAAVAAPTGSSRFAMEDDDFVAVVVNDGDAIAPAICRGRI